jgi:hypothetical protein
MLDGFRTSYSSHLPPKSASWVLNILRKVRGITAERSQTVLAGVAGLDGLKTASALPSNTRELSVFQKYQQ